MLKHASFQCILRCSQPPGQPIGVNVHCTQHPIREQALSSQPSQKTQKLSTQMKNHSHASRIPSFDQSEMENRMENTNFAMPSIIDSHDMGLRTVYSPDAQKKTPIQRLFFAAV
ncbi:hypothetical protein TNCV_3908741 [Trichonephila clavipes]|nr:hypothetical protein TNCV_3908741 [Trichonephila clavipes]